MFLYVALDPVVCFVFLWRISCVAQTCLSFRDQANLYTTASHDSETITARCYAYLSHL